MYTIIVYSIIILNAGIPTLQQPNSTCSALENFLNTSGYGVITLGSCTINKLCLSVRCVSLNSFGLTTHTVTFFPCSSPLAVSVLVVNQQHYTQVNVTTTTSVTVRFRQFIATMFLRMEWSDDNSTVGLGVSYKGSS